MVPAFPQFITIGETPVAAAFVLVFPRSVINLIWFGAMVVLLARLGALARRSGFQRWPKGVTGVAFIGFGLRLASIRPVPVPVPQRRDRQSGAN